MFPSGVPSRARIARLEGLAVEMGVFSGMKRAPPGSAGIRGVQKGGRGAAGEVKLRYSVCLRRSNIHLIGFHGRPGSHRLCLLFLLRGSFFKAATGRLLGVGRCLVQTSPNDLPANDDLSWIAGLILEKR